MKLVTYTAHDEVITQALIVAENVALGEIENLFIEYAAQYDVSLSFELVEGLRQQLTVVYPPKVLEIRELRWLMESGKEMNVAQIASLIKILDAYSRIGHGQFHYALDGFTEDGRGSELISFPEYTILRNKLTKLDSDTDWGLDHLSLSFLLAYEISKKLIHDLSWVQYPLGGHSSNFELPKKYTKVPFPEIKKI